MDGSGFNEGIGKAAVLLKGRPRHIDYFKAYLGPPSKHNTYEAAIVCAILTTWLISNCPNAIGKKVFSYINKGWVVLQGTGSLLS
jgi:hypothetical protein